MSRWYPLGALSVVTSVRKVENLLTILPPMSVPTPSGDPWLAIKADSPPELPPEVRLVLNGLETRP